AETFYRFFRKMVFVEVVSESSIMTVYVRAFDPSVAQNLANFIVEQSEKTINELNQRMAASQTSLAQRELAKSMERLSEAKDRVLQFQIANAMVDPVGETAAHFSNVA